jgi:hypothetical protein
LVGIGVLKSFLMKAHLPLGEGWGEGTIEAGR